MLGALRGSVGRQKFCAKHKQRLAKYGSFDRPMREPKVKPPKPIQHAVCRHCGAEFIRDHGAVFCSDPCRAERARELDARWALAHRPSLPASAKACPDCGSDFIAGKRKAYCTTKCMNRASRSRRRAREVGAYVEDVWRSKVYERDGYTCQLCRKPVKMAAEVPHPKAPTLDHVIPLAAGGTHEYANVQLAHFICNSRKSAGHGQLNLDLIGVHTERVAS